MAETPNSSALATVRSLLRRLRDLNLAARVAVRAGAVVRLAGCASLDTPVEHGVHYRLIDASGARATLVLRARAAGIEIELGTAAGDRHLWAPCLPDRRGRPALPSLSARLPEGSSDPLAYARVLRRVVRRLYA